MTALFWQTALLLLAAYFLGAWIACLVRRTFFSRPRSLHIDPEKPTSDSEEPSPENSGKGLQVQTTDRFARALVGSASTERPQQEHDTDARIRALRELVQAATDPQPSREKSDGPVSEIAPSHGDGQKAEPFSRPESLSPMPEREPAKSDPSMLPIACGTSGLASVSANAVQNTVDDLEEIRGIDSEASQFLREKEIISFSQMAAWTARDVRDLETALQQKGRISRQNWIEQAAMLACGSKTLHAIQRSAGRPDIVSKLDSGSAPNRLAFRQDVGVGVNGSRGQQDKTSPASEALPTARTDHDDLTRIDGINDEVARLLGGHGVTRFSQIASWSEKDMQDMERLLGVHGRLEREQWVRQAKEIAGIDENQITSSDGATLAEPIGNNIRKPEHATVGNDPQPTDDLKLIRGIGVLIEKKLNAIGVRRFDQIAHWTAQDIARVSDGLDFKDRIEREDWVGQARILASGGRTEFSDRLAPQ